MLRFMCNDDTICRRTRGEYLDHFMIAFVVAKMLRMRDPNVVDRPQL